MHSYSFDADNKLDDAGNGDSVDESLQSPCSRSNPSDCGDRNVHRYTKREEQICDALQYAPEIKPWMSSLINLVE